MEEKEEKEVKEVEEVEEQRHPLPLVVLGGGNDWG
jgi:hypothetical protein